MFLHGTNEAIDELARRCTRIARENVGDALLSEHFLLCVHRLGDTIGVNHESAVRFEGNRLLFKHELADHSERYAPRLESPGFFVRREKEWVVVPGVGKYELMVLRVKDAIEQRSELLRTCALEQKLIRAFEANSRRSFDQCLAA